MAKAKRLTMGTDSPAPTPDEEKERVALLHATVETYLPDFAKGVAEAAVQMGRAKDSTMVLHQDVFAGYDDDEYTLLGMAVKYAGLHGVVVTVIGKNHESF